MISPLRRPILSIREAILKDAPFLLAAAGSYPLTLFNLPRNLEGMEQKINRSQRSFRGSIQNPSEREHMFTILSGTGVTDVPVGTSTFYPKHGTPEKPHNYWQFTTSGLLVFREDHDGPAEVGGMVLHRLCAGKGEVNHGPHMLSLMVEGVRHAISIRSGYGRAGSWVRFFWAAMPGQRENYREGRCLTEFLPPLEETPSGGQTNPFYEYLAPRFFDSRPYEEMDRLTLEDQTLLRRLLPASIRYLDLPPDVRRMIGNVAPQTQPAVQLLKTLGFRFFWQIDPIDAGPHYQGLFIENPIFRGAREVFFQGEPEETQGERGWQYGFVGFYAPSEEVVFRACATPFRLEGNQLWTVHETIQSLGLRVGQQITVSPFP